MSPHSQRHIKILDLGLAHLDAGGSGPDELTASGHLMGTVDYMAPEQAIDAHSADGRADIYSLGATLWYLLTGQCMYAGRTTAGKLLAQQTEPVPSLGSVCPDVPLSLATAFSRMVAKRPEDRYQTMADVIADLEPLLPRLDVALLGTPSNVGAGDQATSRLGVASRATLSDNRLPWGRNWPQRTPAGAGGLLLICLAVWVVIRDEAGKEVARVRLPEGGSVSREPDTPAPRSGLPVDRQVPRTRGAGADGAWSLPPGAPPPAIAPFDAAQAKAHQAAWAQCLGVPVEMENSIGMRFMLIPPGEFDMGSAEGEIAKLLTPG